VAAEVWCEAQGGLGFWSAAAHPWGVPVFSGAGVIPTSAAQQLAARTVEDGRNRLVLLVTDHDPAGYVIADRLAAETDTFLANDYAAGLVKWQRLAVTDGQVERFGLRWGGSKVSAGRRMERTVEAEALTSQHPAAAAGLLNDLLASWLDLDQIEATKAAWAPHAAFVHDLLAGPPPPPEDRS
jgi:hypothetical protein